MHLVEAEDANRAGLLLCPRVVGADADALEWVEVADFVSDRTPTVRLFAVKNFRDAAVVKAGLDRDVARRETSLLGSLEALAARGARFVPLLLGALKRSLETPHLGSGLLLVGGVRDCGSLRAVAAIARSRPRKQP